MKRDSYVRKIPGPAGASVEIIIPGDDAGLDLAELQAMIGLIREFADAMEETLEAILD